MIPFLVDYIKAIENPNKIGWNGKVWNAPNLKGYDKNQRGYGIDIRYNKEAKELTKNRPGLWITENEANTLMNNHLKYIEGVAKRKIKGFDNFSREKLAAILGMLYRGDSVQSNVNINEPDDMKFLDSVHTYYKSKGLNERALNSEKFLNQMKRNVSFTQPIIDYSLLLDNTRIEKPIIMEFKKGGKMSIIKLFKEGGKVRKMLTAAGGPIIQLTPEGLKYLEWSKMTPKLRRQYRNNRAKAYLSSTPSIGNLWEALLAYIGNRDPKNPYLITGEAPTPGMRNPKQIIGVAKKVENIVQRAAQISDKIFDIQYFKALNSGNPQRVKAIRNLHFKGKSIDNQINKQLYHGTPEVFNEFKITDTADPIFHTTETKEVASKIAGSKGRILNLFGYSKNPLRISDLGIVWHPSNIARELKVQLPRDKVRYPLESYERELFYKLNNNKTFREEANRSFMENELKGDSYVYKNEVEGGGDSYAFPTSRQLKLSNSITYDDSGNIIPISKRDNFLNNDIRYKNGGKMNIIEQFKNGRQIRKMLTAAGGPLKVPLVKINGKWTRLQSQGDGNLSAEGRLFQVKTKPTNALGSGNDLVVTPRKKATVQTTPKPTQEYRSAFDSSAVPEFINAMTAGGFNNLSPTQWARRVYDTVDLMKGNMSQKLYINSWINGNNGVVSLNFKEEHPVLSNSINGGIDLATFSLPKVSLFPVHFVLLVATPITSTYIGAKLGDEVDKYLPKKIQGYGGMLGYMLGAGAGIGALYKNSSNIPVIHTKYKKLNDVINYPITTAAATVKGKYPWTKKQDIRLKRQLFDDIEEARNFLLKSGYLLEDLPTIRIAKKSLYLEGELGHYNPYYNTVTVKSTINPYSNLPIESLESVGSGFKGLVNHELTHGRLQYFGAFSEFDPKAGYYVPRKDIKTPVFDPFRKKKAGSWTASPDEFDAELSNLLISTGKLPTEPVDNIFPLQARFGIWNKNKAREIENLILLLRKNGEFF